MSAAATGSWRTALLPAPPEDGQETWRHLPAWLAVAFALRAAFALGGDYVLHPDEIMQYLEPAHRAVFGSGIVFWEFQYGGRSWLVPGFVAAILKALDLVGLGEPRVYVHVVKIAFCALSLLIPWGSYHFARRAFGEEPAKIALVLACLWPYLVFFAHKPFTEFVSTALLFGALGVACRPKQGGAGTAFLFGLLAALAAAVRIQYLPLSLIVLAAVLAWAGRRQALSALSGIAAVAVAVAVLETLTWGSPFHSYVANYSLNMGLEGVRTPQPTGFYLPRLLFATAGGILLMLYAFARRPRRHLLAILLVLAAIVPHMAHGHKEFRFVFVLLPLCLAACGDLFASWAGRWPRLFSPRSASEVSIAAIFLLAGNVVDDRWLYHANSLERGDVRYLVGQGNMFDAYLALSGIEDVKGVLHIDDPYFNTPGYYYLHHDVPLYDVRAFREAVSGGAEPRELFTHFVARSGIADLPDMIALGGEGEEYVYGFVSGEGEVRQWKSNTPNMTDPDATRLLSEVLGYVEPPVFEYADD